MDPTFTTLSVTTDLLRALHLICLSLGLGTAIYLDARTIRRMATPLTETDLAEVDRIHRAVTLALMGLWLSGLALMYLRTGFHPASFTPKLWIKLIVVTLMTANAILIHRYALPLLTKSKGRPLLTLPTLQLCTLILLAAISAFCWISGLALGSSASLKMQNWGLLLPMFLSGFVAITLGSLLILAFLCTKFSKQAERSS